jgi:hypothetical protein
MTMFKKYGVVRNGRVDTTLATGKSTAADQLNCHPKKVVYLFKRMCQEEAEEYIRNKKK